MSKSLFRSAVEDTDGFVDIGYLCLWWGMIGWLAALLVILLLGIAAVALRTDDSAADVLTAMGIAIVAASTGFATMLGAVGLFRMGDKDRPVAVQIAAATTVTEERKTTTRVDPVPVPAVPLNVTPTDASPRLPESDQPVEVIVKNVTPVPVKETT